MSKPKTSGLHLIVADVSTLCRTKSKNESLIKTIINIRRQMQ